MIYYIVMALDITSVVPQRGDKDRALKHVSIPSTGRNTDEPKIVLEISTEDRTIKCYCTYGCSPDRL